MKVLTIIAQKGFQDIEYNNSKEAIEKEDIQVITASPTGEEAIGKYDGRVQPDLAINQAKSEDYDAISIIGGPGAPSLADCPELFTLLKQFQGNNKIIAAICIAPTILARAGLLQGKKATVWNGDNMQSTVIEQQGAEYLAESVVIDDRIITADGPSSAQDYGKAIADVLKQQEP
ncbi:DJ-1/PfpI family protein [Candidatus Woesearchaeota archaeon]|nr:DJ-1/PfpI family protein [Candidatus Woesearchaeota archaeon]